MYIQAYISQIYICIYVISIYIYIYICYINICIYRHYKYYSIIRKWGYSHFCDVARRRNCAAVLLSVLQNVEMFCSVMQCVAVCCSVLQRGAVWFSVVQCVAVCCRVLQSFRGSDGACRKKCAVMLCPHRKQKWTSNDWRTKVNINQYIHFGCMYRQQSHWALIAQPYAHTLSVSLSLSYICIYII